MDDEEEDVQQHRHRIALLNRHCDDSQQVLHDAVVRPEGEMLRSGSGDPVQQLDCVLCHATARLNRKRQQHRILTSGGLII